MALRTNSKQVKLYFDNYINDILVDCFDGEIKKMVEQFYESARDGAGRLAYCYKTLQEAFTTISESYGEIYYDDMRNVLKEALQETQEESEKYENEKVAHLYNSLLYMAFCRKCDAEKVNYTNIFKYR